MSVFVAMCKGRLGRCLGWMSGVILNASKGGGSFIYMLEEVEIFSVEFEEDV